MPPGSLQHPERFLLKDHDGVEGEDSLAGLIQF